MLTKKTKKMRSNCHDLLTEQALSNRSVLCPTRVEETPTQNCEPKHEMTYKPTIIQIKERTRAGRSMNDGLLLPEHASQVITGHKRTTIMGCHIVHLCPNREIAKTKGLIR